MRQSFRNQKTPGAGAPCVEAAASRAFTLIELLVVIAVIAILAAVLFPVLGRAKLRARITRVQSDLRQVGIAIDMYTEDNKGLPPVRSCCTGSERWDYYEIPKEIVGPYLSQSKMFDPFNETRSASGMPGRTYKYLAINWGYSGVTHNPKSPPWFSMWIPADYPLCKADAVLYYRYAGEIYAWDNGSNSPKEPPVKWAVWSVGPGGDPGLEATGTRLLPFPASEWYPSNSKGVIARFSDGRQSR